jgi:hypothetical protein
MPRYRLSVRASLVILAFAFACAVGASAAAAAHTGKQAPVRATFVGDSVSASILYTTTAQKQLAKGVKVRLDLKVCRRLVQPSCPYQGSTPSTALQAVRSYGRSLGNVLIVKVGYNESSSGYGKGIDQVMRAARDIYRSTNVAIRQAAKRWPQLVVADWNAYSAGKPWFGSDGLHLTAAGADGLATFLRQYVIRAAALGA